MRCTAVQRVSKVGFDWIFEIRVGKLMRITCVFNANSTRTNRWAVVYIRYPQNVKEKSIPRDNRLLSLGKPHDANR